MHPHAPPPRARAQEYRKAQSTGHSFVFPPPEATVSRLIDAVARANGTSSSGGSGGGGGGGGGEAELFAALGRGLLMLSVAPVLVSGVAGRDESWGRPAGLNATECSGSRCWDQSTGTQVGRTASLLPGLPSGPSASLTCCPSSSCGTCAGPRPVPAPASPTPLCLQLWGYVTSFLDLGALFKDGRAGFSTLE
jgi:hypothetical protein